MKIKLQIKARWTGSVIFEYESEGNTIAKTVSEAIKSSANLSSANLSYADLSYADLSTANLSSANLSSADLSYADLSYADLSSANLSSANLRSADLSYADLSYADLSYADLSYADLRYADLSSADLSSANLRSANLRYADLRYADLSYADLSSANLSSIKNDYWDVLLKGIPEIENLRVAIVEGKIDGSTYEGECACLFGTLEKTSDQKLKKLIREQRNLSRPIEVFFAAIKKGDTPKTNQASKIALDWLDEFIGYISFGAVK